jgi:hypothetical protein
MFIGATAARLGLVLWLLDDGGPSPTAELVQRGEIAAQAGATVFLEFDGGNLSRGAQDDAPADVTSIADLAGPFPPFGADAATQAAVLQAVSIDWAAYDISFTDTRPDIDEYTMVMVGPSPAFGAGVLGVAKLDCGDLRGNDIVFAFHAAGDGYSTASVAATISQELGHALGLEHVQDPADVMYPINSGGDPAFLDSCLPTVEVPASCAAEHAETCGSGSLQNSHLELLALLGPRPPDDGAAAVRVTTPADGAVFAPDTPIEIRVEAPASYVIRRARLYVDGHARSVDDTAPFGFTTQGATEGTYEFFVEAHDDADVIAFSPRITVSIRALEASHPDAALPPDYGLDDGDDDAACSVDHRGRFAGQWLPWVLVVVSRRRAHARAGAAARALVRDPCARATPPYHSPITW